MLQIEQTFGTLDWRLPHAHSLYWAQQGARTAEDFNATRCERITLHSLASMARGGTLTGTPTPGEAWQYRVTPRLDLLPVINQRYERAKRQFPRSGLDVAQRYFLVMAIQEFEAAGRGSKARTWYAKLLALLPETIPNPTFAQVLSGEVALGE